MAEPLDVLISVDELLSAAAADAPDRAALVHAGSVTTFAELDRQVDVAADWVADLLARHGTPVTGSTVAVTAVPRPDFAVVYLGVLRSGNVVAATNPLLPPATLAGVLRDGQVRLAIGPESDSVPTAPLAEWRTGGPHRPPRPARSLDAPASVLFTSGTTGDPKAVLLSARNLAVNAAQTAMAHRLRPGSVAGNGLPSYHPMHLNSALHAGATQVLCWSTDPAESMRLAAAHAVTHYYSLPVLLTRLADHPDLPRLRAPALRMIASGGSALAPALACLLSAHFKVPVVQGYGLAETSPLTHFDLPEDPHPESVGLPVVGTECRTVEVGGRRVLGVDEVGEVQVRGPQVMLGYLGGGGGGSDGWLATGDIGRIAADGRLYLVDRLKDVFKHDNWLVSPTAVERALLARPEITDCCVLDRPDPVHGGVAHALVVGGSDARAAVDAVNADLAYYERVGSVELVPAIPRSPNGKVPRAALRARLHRGGPESAALPSVRWNGERTMVTLVNKFTVSGDPAEFERIWVESSEFMRTQAGFRGFRLVRSVNDPTVYINIAEWAEAADHQRVVRGESFRRHIEAIAVLAKAEPELCSVVIECDAS
ncbi:AMP-binding protein [Actinokineospora enzanensis]|uniref:AMP-binding protein n=1 Tax=Actinokineospora enzanensis TaxID=155975 RepID=UPI00035D084B|nr:AMP-binding protein [Actinokineospora enzanensis]